MFELWKWFPVYCNYNKFTIFIHMLAGDFDDRFWKSLLSLTLSFDYECYRLWNSAIDKRIKTMTESVSNSSTAYCSPPSTQPRFYNHHDPSTFDDSNNSDLINSKSNGLDFQNFSDGSIKDIIDIIDNSQ